MDSYDSDELFNKFIEINEESDSVDEAEDVSEKKWKNIPIEEVSGSAKENKNIPTNPRKSRITKDQYNKIVAFVKEFNEELIEKKQYNQLWDNLTIELNSIGPPMHSSTNWRRKWSEYKYRTQKRVEKRKRSSSVTLDEVLKSTSRDQPSHSSRPVDTIPVADEVMQERVSFHTKILEKLDVVIEKLDISNNVLLDIAKKP